jgi:hypothetical protein
MFLFDVETLGVESNSVILSMACVYFKSGDTPSHQELKDSAFFCKFDVSDQVNRFGRKIDRDTIGWWKKQCKNAQIKSFIPNKDWDVPFEAGHAAMKLWVDSKNDPNCWVWARGGLDDVVLSSMERASGCENIFAFHRWRDVRTAVDFLYGTTSGYVKTEVPGWVDDFDPALHITKHNPVDDCVFDAMQLLYGVKNDTE